MLLKEVAKKECKGLLFVFVCLGVCVCVDVYACVFVSWDLKFFHVGEENMMR